MIPSELSQDNVYVIAEAGCNHNGDFALAERLVDAAAATGANAVKFQTFVPERMITKGSPKADYQIKATGTAESQFDRLRRMRLSREQHLSLIKRCQDKGIAFSSSAFDHESLDLLAEFDLPFIKIPSGEITNTPYLEHAAGLGIPVVLSTGMSDLADIERALNALAKGGVRDVVLLHCLSDYPSRWAEANLRVIATLQQTFGLPVGFSDHSQGIELPLLAVALGAVMVEKHITLDRTMEGGDHKASLEPEPFTRMVSCIRRLGPALGDGIKRCMDSERNVRDVARKSIVAGRGIPKGAVLGPDDLLCKRPGTGIPPYEMEKIIGLAAARDIAEDEMLSWTDLAT